MRESRNKFQGGGFRPGGQKTVWTTFTVYREDPINGFITEKTMLFQGSRGGPTFSGGGGGGGGGVEVQMLIYLETHIT